MSVPAEPVIAWERLSPVALAPGVSARLLHLDRLMLTQVTLDPGAPLPEHDHPHEQIGTLVAGGLRLTIDGVAHALSPGDAYRIPSGVRHAALAGEDGAVVVEAFSPLREDWVALAG
jgi:quercetin dioxygenase-like cupin family protein